MQHIATFVPATDRYAGTLEADIALLAQGGLPVLSAALAELDSVEASVEETMTQMIVVEALCAIVDGFETQDATAAVATIAAMSREQAIFAHDMLLFARFDGGMGDTATLDDAGVLTLAALTVATDRPAAAIDLLDDEATRRGDAFVAGAGPVHAYADTAIFAL